MDGWHKWAYNLVVCFAMNMNDTGTIVLELFHKMGDIN